MLASLLTALLIGGGTLLAFAAIFLPLEWAFPAKKQAVFRPGWFTDLCFYLGQTFLWTGLVYVALFAVRALLQQWIPESFRAAVAGQPWWLQVAEVLVLSDLCVYWGHRWQHANPWLWRFHAVHHSSEHLDWLAAFREHPLDTLYTVGLINLPAFVLGFPLGTIAGFAAFRGLWAIYIHSNVRMPTGPLRWLLGAPELHHWHHDRDPHAGNYANVSPLMDLLFGTYRCPNHEPAKVGIRDEYPRGYWAQLLVPLLPKAWVRRRRPNPTPAFSPPLFDSGNPRR